MSATADIQSPDMARGIVESIDGEKIVIRVPHTEYRIQLVATAPVSVEIGKRVKGTIHAQAQRMFVAQGGGRFIEPIWGEPRIVAGSVLAVDAANRRVLVDVAVPIWMTLEELQDADPFKVGQLVNCYIRSGTRFTPSV